MYHSDGKHMPQNSRKKRKEQPKVLYGNKLKTQKRDKIIARVQTSISMHIPEESEELHHYCHYMQYKNCKTAQPILQPSKLMNN